MIGKQRQKAWATTRDRGTVGTVQRHPSEGTNAVLYPLWGVQRPPIGSRDGVETGELIRISHTAVACTAQYSTALYTYSSVRQVTILPSLISSHLISCQLVLVLPNKLARSVDSRLRGLRWPRQREARLPKRGGGR